jgi:MFS family permease
MIAITPLITPLAGRIGAGRAIGLGFLLATVGFGALAFVDDSWQYAMFVLPMIVLAIGLGFANGPASSGSTAAVSADQVGAASGISNMARYVGAAVAVAAVATISNAVTVDRQNAGDTASEALAAGLASASLLMAILSALGVALVVLMRRHHIRETRRVDLAAAAAASTHTIPTEPTAARSTP